MPHFSKIHPTRQLKSLVILGPTASGKSDIAISLAKKFNGEVISSDSRQVYRHMDIGTGKVPGKNTFLKTKDGENNRIFISDRVPHWMIDIVEPSTHYNVGKFQKKATRIQKDILDRSKIPIICGGTGFWTQALVENIDLPPVLPNPDLRKKLEECTPQELYEKLLKQDPNRAQQIPQKNRIHLIRALEICEELGSVPSINKKKNNPVQYLIIVLDIPREILHEKIQKRFELWLNDGFLDEIYTLHHTYRITWKRIENFGLEYKWGSRYIRGIISETEFREYTIRDLKRYAKRQLTWIRRWEKQGQKIYWKKNQSEIEKISKDFLYSTDKTSNDR